MKAINLRQCVHQIKAAAVTNRAVFLWVSIDMDEGWYFDRGPLAYIPAMLSVSSAFSSIMRRVEWLASNKSIESCSRFRKFWLGW